MSRQVVIVVIVLLLALVSGCRLLSEDDEPMPIALDLTEQPQLEQLPIDTVVVDIDPVDTVFVEIEPVEELPVELVSRVEIAEVDTIAQLVCEDTMLLKTGSLLSLADDKAEPYIPEYTLVLPTSKKAQPKSTYTKVVPKFLRVEEPVLFMPKKQWLFGGSVNYADLDLDNYKFLIADDFEGKGYYVNSKVYAAYAIKDNLALGFKAAYSRAFVDLSNLDLSLGEDLSFNINDLYLQGHDWSGTVFMRNFLPLFGSRQFALFSDTQVILKGGHSKLVSGKDESLVGTYQNYYDISLGFTPGVMVFINNISACELSVGVLGFSTRVTDQVTNQVYTGSRRTSSAEFGIDIFSISLGFTIYLNSRRY